MLAIIGAVLIIAWLMGLAFHVTAGAIHAALVIGLILVIAHFVMGSRTGRTV